MSVKVETGPGVDPYRKEKEGKLREIGNQAVWSLSSCKPGTIYFWPWLLLRRCNLSNIGDHVWNISSNAENNPNSNIYTASYVWQVAAL